MDGRDTGSWLNFMDIGFECEALFSSEECLDLAELPSNVPTFDAANPLLLVLLPEFRYDCSVDWPRLLFDKCMGFIREDSLYEFWLLRFYIIQSSV